MHRVLSCVRRARRVLSCVRRARRVPSCIIRRVRRVLSCVRRCLASAVWLGSWQRGCQRQVGLFREEPCTFLHVMCNLTVTWLELLCCFDARNFSTITNRSLRPITSTLFTKHVGAYKSPYTKKGLVACTSYKLTCKYLCNVCSIPPQYQPIKSHDILHKMYVI